MGCELITALVCHTLLSPMQAKCLASSLKGCLSDGQKCQDCYLPLFNLGDKMWSPLRVELFERLRCALPSLFPSVVDAVFTQQYNPTGNAISVSSLTSYIRKCARKRICTVQVNKHTRKSSANHSIQLVCCYCHPHS